jgi:hypothetical protein
MTEDEWYVLLLANHQDTAHQPVRYPPSHRRPRTGCL